MAALTAPRNTSQHGLSPIAQKASYPVLASTKIYAGALVALSAAGYAKPAATGDTKVVGVAQATVDNSSGANGALEVPVARGAFWLNNKGGDLVTQADIATPALCYVEDDNTVRHTATASIAAGRPIRIGGSGGDPAGVLVEIY